MPSQKEIAAHLDLSQPEVSKAMADLGIDWRNEDMSRVRVAYIRKLRLAAAGHRSSDGDDLVKERVLTERVDRELKELQLLEKRGQLVAVADLERELHKAIAAFRAELLARDDKLMDDLRDLYALEVDPQVIKDYTHAALEQLARYEPGGAGVGAPAGDAPAPAGGDDDDGLGADLPPPEPQGHGATGPIQP